MHLTLNSYIYNQHFLNRLWWQLYFNKTFCQNYSVYMAMIIKAIWVQFRLSVLKDWHLLWHLLCTLDSPDQNIMDCHTPQDSGSTLMNWSLTECLDTDSSQKKGPFCLVDEWDCMIFICLLIIRKKYPSAIVLIVWWIFSSKICFLCVCYSIWQYVAIQSLSFDKQSNQMEMQVMPNLKTGLPLDKKIDFSLYGTTVRQLKGCKQLRWGGYTEWILLQANDLLKPGSWGSMK